MSYGSTASSFAYDALGRLKTEQTTMSGVTKETLFSYMLNGSPASINYPHVLNGSGRLVSYVYDGAGRPISVADGTRTYATVGISGANGYGPTGAVLNGKLGANVTLTNSYNKRLQPVTLSATGASNALLMSKTYDFHLGNGNNGNVWAVTDGLDALNIASRQIGSATFTYDTLNRIASAQSTGTDCTTLDAVKHISKNWGNSYAVDAWGNLTTKTPTKPGCYSENLNETVNAANRFIAPHQYDTAGNMTDNLYGYDAENRLVSLGGVATYTYDADGQRVAKPNMLYWAGSTSDALSESNAGGTVASEYIFFAGKRVVRIDAGTPETVRYYIADHLGSASVIADEAGISKGETMYYPFGAERWSSGTDTNHYKFTGKERDTETGLDYFGARYNASNMGRFMSPDPLPWIHWQHGDKDDQKKFESYLENPQNLNMYAYVLNNPLNKTDPTGMNACGTSDDASCKVTITIQDRSKDANGAL
jgi:RHS repeat-associated protein